MSHTDSHSDLADDFSAPQPAFAHASGNRHLAPSPGPSAISASYRDDPEAEAYAPSSPSPNNSTALLGGSTSAAAAAPTHDASAEKMNDNDNQNGNGTKKRNGKLIGVIALAALAIVILAVVLPVYFLVVKPHRHSSALSSSSSGSSSSSSGSSGSSSSGGANGGGNSGGEGDGGVVAAITGGDGSTVTTANGTTFVYRNAFGGYWIADPSNPFASGARPNSWTPALNETWTWGVDRVNGVNLGGWFVLEPFITPALFQAYPGAVDEWSLSTLMRADNTLQTTMEAHYDGFITEQDIAQIAGAGLNWIRVPIPFWAISTWSDVGADATGTVAEPFLEGVCWKYIVRLLGWARKYGLRVNLDLHTIPGSQNGYNHSGKIGQINFLNGPMGIANAQRAVDYIRVIMEFVAQEEWRDVVQMFGVVNEARMAIIGRPALNAFYLELHTLLRGITGFGAGNGPYIGVHDGFQGVASWAGFMPGSDRIILDTHPYFAFDGAPNNQPIATADDPDSVDAGGRWPAAACSTWGASLNTSREQFGVTVAGEWSNGYNDCGLYLNGVPGSNHYGDCSLWEDSSSWNASVKAGVQAFAEASMDALGDWFFWTWKIAPAANGIVSSPLWSYQLGLENGWMPTDPRTARGKCAAIGESGEQFAGTFSAWQTGGAGAGTVDPAWSSSYSVWPPVTISNVDADVRTVMPTYTATGNVATLTYITPTQTGAGATSTVTPTVSAGDGWFDKGDTALGVTAVAGCTYPAAWEALTLPAPTALCTGAPA
ncbi:glycoside hydrolase family 5 protein [Mycena metata]|uniref:glucan 1,3-beta-glucosidase n=1 Tax=Mycena metata TaxID=1033252 RepID=A0AAD7IYW5_9AGAR|nr:glycoside hydrolase family 5 protein [Mycena metata]